MYVADTDEGCVCVVIEDTYARRPSLMRDDEYEETVERLDVGGCALGVFSEGESREPIERIRILTLSILVSGSFVEVVSVRFDRSAYIYIPNVEEVDK